MFTNKACNSRTFTKLFLSLFLPSPSKPLFFQVRFDTIKKFVVSQAKQSAAKIVESVFTLAQQASVFPGCHFYLLHPPPHLFLFHLLSTLYFVLALLYSKQSILFYQLYQYF